MLVQIRGTSGSGKSTAMRTLMTAWGTWQPVSATGRKKPLYYQCGWDPPGWTVVLGHYESPCGGVDTIGSAKRWAEMVGMWGREVAILSEGLLLSEDVRHTSDLAGKGYDVRAIFLTTPLAVCLRQIGQRRAEAGTGDEVDPTNTTNRVRTIERARLRLSEAGVRCVRASARQVPDLIMRWLRDPEGTRVQSSPGES